ncbi:hypothetical protein [Wenyingzhuangia sp. IMCC45574]
MKSELKTEKQPKEEHKNKPLTNQEWLTFFILPFFTPKHWYRDDHFSISEMERFKKYGYQRKIQQASTNYYIFLFL